MDLFWCISVTIRVQTFRFSVFTGAFCLKHGKQAKLKHVFAQNFKIIRPIQDSTKSKGMDRAFQLCIKYGDGEVSTQGYSASKFTKNFQLKKKIRPQ